MGQNTEEKFLERLTRAFLHLDAEKHVNTKEFNAAVEAILPVFDHLGENHSPFISGFGALCWLTGGLC